MRIVCYQIVWPDRMFRLVFAYAGLAQMCSPRPLWVLSNCEHLGVSALCFWAKVRIAVQSVILDVFHMTLPNSNVMVEYLVPVQICRHQLHRVSRPSSKRALPQPAEPAAKSAICPSSICWRSRAHGRCVAQAGSRCWPCWSIPHGFGHWLQMPPKGSFDQFLGFHLGHFSDFLTIASLASGCWSVTVSAMTRPEAGQKPPSWSSRIVATSHCSAKVGSSSAWSSFSFA